MLMLFLKLYVNFLIINIFWIYIQIQIHLNAITVVFFYLRFLNISFFNLIFL